MEYKYEELISAINDLVKLYKNNSFMSSIYEKAFIIATMLSYSFALPSNKEGYRIVNRSVFQTNMYYIWDYRNAYAHFKSIESLDNALSLMCESIKDNIDKLPKEYNELYKSLISNHKRKINEI